jgi:1,4-alpha-glucan branching enzyme
MTLALEQIDRIVGNQHHNPFEILGPHQVEENGKNVWVVRSYLPNAESVSVMIPATRQELYDRSARIEQLPAQDY